MVTARECLKPNSTGPIKLFLEAQGYVVKGEIEACDVMAVKGDAGPVIVELKERLSLALILSGGRPARLF